MISEIVNIMEEIVLGMNNSLPISIEKIEKLLPARYDKNMVAAAYSWIYEKRLREKLNGESQHRQAGIRVLSPEELESITVENYDYIFHYYNIGLLNNRDINILFDKLAMVDSDNINKEIINILILSLFIDLQSYSMPGSRLILNSSDTIN